MRNSKLPITTSGWVKSITTSVLPSVSRLSGSPRSTSADSVRSSAACTAPTIVDPTLPLAPSTPTRMDFTLARAGHGPQGSAPGPAPACAQRAFLADIAAAGLSNGYGGLEALEKEAGEQ